jgi:hypothetical protein
LEVIERGDEFLTGIHHERTLRGHWLANRLATEQHNFQCRFRRGLHDNRVASSEDGKTTLTE